MPTFINPAPINIGGSSISGDIEVSNFDNVARITHIPDDVMQSANRMPPGTDGADGSDGPPGPAGLQGPSGTPGAQGAPGVPGSDGVDGADGSPGIPGPQGLVGATGPQGAPGVGFPGVDGEDGNDGPPGLPGVAGATGATGAQGSAGVPGPPGDPGEPGESGFPGIPGPQGAQGIAGATGPQGPPGIGIPGLDGEDGSDGRPGPPGAAGATGATGAQGVTGMPGAPGDQGQDSEHVIVLQPTSVQANMAQATIKLRAAGTGTGQPIDGTIQQALDMLGTTNHSVVVHEGGGAGSYGLLTSGANGRHLFTDGSGAVVFGDPTSAAGGTDLDTTGTISVVPYNNDDIILDSANGIGFSRNMNRCIWWDDFTVVQGASVGAGQAFIISETAWVVTNSAGGTGTVSGVDGGAAGTAVSPGEINIATSATTGTQLDMHKGSSVTSRCFRASDIRSIKWRALITSAASVHISMGLNDSSFGSLDCARFDFDSSVDTTTHVISANSGGATTANTDINLAPGTTYHEYEIRSPSQASVNWEYYYDGALVATHVTTSKARGVNFYLSIANLTAANKDLRIDYVSFEGWPTR